MRKEIFEFEIKDIIEIEKIVLDNDKERALEYLEQIYRLLKEREKSHCKTSFAWGKNLLLQK